MFRKLISNVAFSPALVGQLGFYAKRLRQEETTRRVGLIFTALALIVQSFAVFQPPEAANAASSSDMVSGGVSNLSQYMSHYDRNTNGVRDLYNTIGITRSEIAKAKPSSINSKGGYLSWGMVPRFSRAQGEGQYNFPKSNGSKGKVFYRPLNLWDSTSYTKKNGSTYKVLVGRSAKMGWFAIMLNCGNLVTKSVPPPPTCPRGEIGVWPNCSKPEPKCTVPGKTHLPVNHPDCRTKPVNTPSPTPPPPPTTPKRTPSPPPPPPPVIAKPIASCSYLRIAQIGKVYSFTGNSEASGGASIKSHTYTVKKDGSVVHKKVIQTSQQNSSYSYTPTGPGSYTVSLEVGTSVGTKSSINCSGQFVVAKPAVCPQNPKLAKDDPECQPCPGDPSLWIKDTKCAAEIVQTKYATNLTQGNVDATTVTAKSDDQITYTITVENKGLQSNKVTMEEHLEDVLEYAELIDNGGGELNQTTKTLTWPELSIEQGAKQSRMFVVKIASEIPAMSQGISDKTSYNCIITNTFGNSIDISIDCPTPKIVEQITTELPQTGMTENMIFAGVLLATVTYFYARSRQMKQEVRLIRHNLNTGTI